ncbi:MAG: EAL domain-containing protein [Ruminiclostridium sp.]
MEVLWIVLTVVLGIAVVICIFAIASSDRRRKLAVHKSEALQNITSKYTVVWRSDLKSVEYSSSLSALLEQAGEKADATSLAAVFGMPINTALPQMLVKALSVDGFTSKITALGGKEKYLEWHSEVVENMGGVSVIASVATDITENVALKQKLSDERKSSAISQENFSIAMESAEIGFISITYEDMEYKVDISENGKKMLGIKEDEKIDIDALNKRVHSVDYSSYIRQFNQLIAGVIDSLNLEIKLLVRRETYHSFMLKFKGVKNEYNNIMRITGAFIDITSQRESYNIKDRNSMEDSLTGLPNRQGFMAEGSDFLRLSKESGKEAVMICIKITRFQKIATLFGMETSDKLLYLYAESLTKCIDNRGVVGKIGTDDFAVLTYYEGQKATERLVKEIQIVIENSCDNKILPSVLKEQAQFEAGICIYDGCDDIMTLYNKANITLYAGENYSGSVCHFFNENVERKVCDRELVEHEIGEALKHGEFELFYQPKISFKTGEILGAEALIRWNHPQKGLIPPIEFIPIAEEMGLITKIDEWGLNQACLQNKRWQAKGLKKIRVSVNMSQAQLYQTDVAGSIKRVLTDSELDPKYLEVELTETMAMLDIDRTISVLNEIKKLGVSISMDDFGTGYSSLSSLKILPIDILKIDRSLVYDIEENDTARFITKAIVDLGKAMNLEVLAEGVETEKQCKLLEELGCDIAQGFYYGRPQTVADLERNFLSKN